MYKLVKILPEGLNYHQLTTYLFRDSLPGTYLVAITKLDPKSDVNDYRAAYFAKLDFLCREVGEKRYDLHNLVKDGLSETSTQSFTEEQWTEFLAKFEQWTFITYSIILP